MKHTKKTKYLPTTPVLAISIPTRRMTIEEKNVEEDNDNGEPRGDYRFRHRAHLVQNTISADRTHDSEFQRTAQILQAIQPNRGLKDQNINQTKVADSKTPRLDNEKTNEDKLGDYQFQLMLLEQQNKERLRVALMEQDAQINHQQTTVQSPVFEDHWNSNIRSTNPEAAFVRHPALSNCFRLISTVLDTPEECTANLPALRENLKSLQACISDFRTTGVLPSPEPRFQIVYRVTAPKSFTRMYLDEPQWIEGENAKGEALAGNLPVRDIQSYLERNPEICFVVYRDFSVPVSRKKDVDHTLSVPKQSSEMIETTSMDLTTTITKFMSYYDFGADAVDEIGGTDVPDHHSTDADGSTELLAPYPAFYHASRRAMDPFLELLKYSEKQQFQLLLDYVMSHFGNEYNDAEEIIRNGRITKRYFQYLFKPGDVIVQKETNEARGLICSSWVTEERVKDDKRKTSGKVSMIQYTIKARYWTFDGVFSRKTTDLKWEIDDSYNSKLEIDGLSICPLAYVNENLTAKLRRRGEWIWKCRTKQLVSYHEDGNRQLHDSDDERYMIDMMVYRELHKPDKKRDVPRWTSSDYPGTDDLSHEAVNRDDPPSDDFLYVLPSIIKGFNLKKKKWLDLKVDNLGEVVWNETAFERLVLEEKTKKLILALVSDQIESKRSTDLISGKGNGLIMLLHGGPGTGKTLTAESVAEIARKPLYPVTCGDIGTEPEGVENYLESVLHLGKTWGCVVLLDEADVFLEQRSLQDLHRNALVSVFLRVLEYYEGILVLTSNRVGTFDEAFKSRIQLAIHYSDLTFYERSKIWENFISRLQDFEEEEIDAADLKDHIKNLAQFEMNGREIRNAITNARQYTRWERKQQQNPENCKLDYAKIKLIIDTASKFDDYIKKLNGGYNYIAVDEGLRLEA
ncbi:hypothetical protein F4815DRAFT_470573 [Daldinia loculata]|nr:hypothetical protein F4815DRAFT_470573 [Daldinia loculata]